MPKPKDDQKTTKPEKKDDPKTTMLEKKCSHHANKRKKFLWRLFACILITVFIILLAILIVWAVLQPKKPTFVLQDATIFNLSVPAPNILTTSIQVTIYSRNPNHRIGIYYDQLDVYATYHSQQITYFTSIPPAYQDSKSVIVWSPFIYGNYVPIAPYNGLALTQDQSSGAVELNIKLDGKVKWRVGSITTGYYHIHVNCNAYIPIGNNQNPGITGIIVGSGVKYQLTQGCSVSV